MWGGKKSVFLLVLPLLVLQKSGADWVNGKKNSLDFQATHFNRGGEMLRPFALQNTVLTAGLFRAINPRERPVFVRFLLTILVGCVIFNSRRIEVLWGRDRGLTSCASPISSPARELLLLPRRVG